MYKSKYKGKGGIVAKVVADSNCDGTRITTMELKYPRFIHAEFMTHRMFSRNASSSRAIPVKKMLEGCTAEPIHWGKNQSGMQAREELDNKAKKSCQFIWEQANIDATDSAEMMNEQGAHKQVINRLTEPFQFINVIVTATEWDNFFKLRLHEDAQPEIYELARCMFEAQDASEPVFLESGDWHLPYITNEDRNDTPQEDLVKASVGRCARVSYKNHDKSDPDIEKDKELAQKLAKAGHWSPFEHQATPMSYDPITLDLEAGGVIFGDGVTHFDRKGVCWSGNFRNWIQYRQLLGMEEVSG